MQRRRNCQLKLKLTEKFEGFRTLRSFSGLKSNKIIYKVYELGFDSNSKKW